MTPTGTTLGNVVSFTIAAVPNTCKAGGQGKTPGETMPRSFFFACFAIPRTLRLLRNVFDFFSMFSFFSLGTGDCEFFVCAIVFLVSVSLSEVSFLGSYPARLTQSSCLTSFPEEMI